MGRYRRHLGKKLREDKKDMRRKKILAVLIAVAIITAALFSYNGTVKAMDYSEIDWESDVYTINLSGGTKKVEKINKSGALIIKGTGTLEVTESIFAWYIRIEGNANVVIKNGCCDVVYYMKIDKNASLTINNYPTYQQAGKYAYHDRLDATTELYGTMNINTNFLGMGISGEFNSYGNLNIYDTNNLCGINTLKGTLNIYSGNVNINTPNGTGVFQATDQTNPTNIYGGNININSKYETIYVQNLNMTGGNLRATSEVAFNGPNIIAKKLSLSNNEKITSPSGGIIKNVNGMSYTYVYPSTTTNVEHFDHDTYCILNSNGTFPGPKEIIIKPNDGSGYNPPSPYIVPDPEISDISYQTVCLLEVGGTQTLDEAALTGYNTPTVSALSIYTIPGLATDKVDSSFDTTKKTLTLTGKKNGLQQIFIRTSGNGKNSLTQVNCYVGIESVFEDATTTFSNDQVIIDSEKGGVALLTGNGITYSLDKKNWTNNNALKRDQKTETGIIYAKKGKTEIEACRYDIVEKELELKNEENIKLNIGEEFEITEKYDKEIFDYDKLTGDSISIEESVIKAEKPGKSTYEIWTKDYAGYDEAGNSLIQKTGYIFNVNVKDPNAPETDETDDASQDDNQNKDQTEGNGSENKDSKGSDSKTNTKYSNEWVNGKWYDEFGNQTYDATLTWKQNETGWWVEDSKGWYPQNQWQKIDGKWYYFCADGYMDYSEYREGCWLNADGDWDPAYSGGHWVSNEKGWWYEDNGWYPKGTSLWVDGTQYWFDSAGWLVAK